MWVHLRRVRMVGDGSGALTEATGGFWRSSKRCWLTTAGSTAGIRRGGRTSGISAEDCTPRAARSFDERLAADTAMRGDPSVGWPGGARRGGIWRGRRRCSGGCGLLGVGARRCGRRRRTHNWQGTRLRQCLGQRWSRRWRRQGRLALGTTKIKMSMDGPGRRAPAPQRFEEDDRGLEVQRERRRGPDRRRGH